MYYFSIKNHTYSYQNEKKSYFCSPKAGELSSVGSEHRPYKAGVVGSSPTVPTKIVNNLLVFSRLFFNLLEESLF